MNVPREYTQSTRERYSGMWGKALYLLTQREPEAILPQLKHLDDVELAAHHMVERDKRNRPEITEKTAEAPLEGFKTAFELATQARKRGFVATETSDELLLELIRSECEQKPNHDETLIGLINARRKQI